MSKSDKNKDKNIKDIKDINENDIEENKENLEDEANNYNNRHEYIENILYECCANTIRDIKKYTYENSVPLAENLKYSDLYDFMCEDK